ncbi:Blue-light-activated protein [Lacunisphaera limnophila]|uniref:histidine kinase n=1 Tax=Lacunisphaera limnophila TaxID=1838286 RepID=A0A1D8AW36_9BACT|nr:PAS domain-containing hybrid sensor histidine kinase/response regulator [Lacunisphaera limnophila]AOS45093.1 Blue-light-activated protein [Lacunisphaera limnophila]
MALEATLTSIWDYDVAANRVQLDGNWSRMLGGPPGETVTPIRELLARVHPDDRRRATKASFDCIAGRTAEYSQEYRFRDQQGEWLWVHSRGRVTGHDEQGRASRMIGTNIDVTQRKATELAASRQLEFLQALNQTTLELMERRSRAAILEALAGHAAPLLEATQVEVALVEGDELVTHAYGGARPTRGGQRAGRREAALSWQAIDAREPVIRHGLIAGAEPAPQYRQAGFQAIALFPILHGPRCLGVLGFMREADQCFNAEDRQKGVLLAQLAALAIHNASVYEDAIQVTEAKTAALRESEQLYRSLVESVSQGNYIADRRSIFTYCNPAMYVLGDFAPGELVGQSSFRLVAEEDRPQVMAKYRQWINDPSIRHVTCEFRVVAKHGRQFWVEQNTDFVRDANGRVLEGRNMLRDISERKEAEAALRRSEAQLRQAQKMESLGTLAGGIAHDFNNILTGILGFTQLSLADLEPGHAAVPWLEGVMKSGERAKGLVQQILTFSRKTESSRSPVRLQSVAHESLDLLRSTLPAMVRLESHLDPGCAAVLADPTEIHQVILNLCTNAWHALPEAGGTIQVTLAEYAVDLAFAADHQPLQPGPHLRLAVEDNGAGMEAETLERIFEPFFTTKEAGKGTGLGLAVVHSVVHAHGGAIRVHSTPGRGTLFEIFLPTLPPAEAPAPAGAPADLPGGRGERVLVVDDEPDSGTVITRLIEKLGYQATYCGEPFQALALLYTNPFDMLVTDLAMPGLPGDELARQALVRRPELPVLLLSGFIEPGKQAKLRQIGVREILDKPPALAELAGALHRCLNGQVTKPAAPH